MKTSSKRQAACGRLRGPGFRETLRELLFGVRRRMDCIQVEVSSRCPGRCGYCPHTTRQGTWRSRDMDMETFTLLWPLMRRAGRVHLQGWGEPLLNPAFLDMAALARKAGCAVSTTICGLRMDVALAGQLVASGIDIVAFSLAGTDAATNASRAGVEFARVCEAIALLQAVRRDRMGVHLEIHFAYLMLASQMEAVRGLPKLMARLGVHAAVISTLDYISTPGLEAEAFTSRETAKLDRATEILAETAAEAQRFGLGFHYELPRHMRPGADCRENIARSLFVSADGSVSPCVFLNVPADEDSTGRRVFGNVREQDPLAIWEGDAFRRFREDLAAREPDSPCRHCPKRFTG